jgi:hypothetical protein
VTRGTCHVRLIAKAVIPVDKLLLLLVNDLERTDISQS